MNILFITATFPPATNGVALSTDRLRREFTRLGHTVGIVGPQVHKKTSSDSYFSFPVIKNFPFLPKDYPLPIPILPRSARKSIEKIPWDIIHAQHPWVLIDLARSLGQARNTPVVFTYHTQYDVYIDHYGWWLPKFIRQLLYISLALEPAKRTNGVIVLVGWMRKKLESLVAPAPIYIVPTTGVPSVFYEQSNRTPQTEVLDRPTFLSISRLSKEKNLQFLLRAVAKWRKIYKSGTLIIIGEGRQKRALVSLSHTLGIFPYVRFLGKVSDADLASWHKGADLLLFTSVTENSPMTILEAMAGGLPAVAINHEATREVIRDGKNGRLTPSEIDAFVDAMKEALLRKRFFSKEAKKTAAAYSMTISAKRLLAVYKRVIRVKRDRR